MNDSLKWSTQLRLNHNPQSTKLQGDKINLPQSALEGLLAAAPTVSAADTRTHNLTNFDPFNPHSFGPERRAREALVERHQQLPHPLTFKLVNPDNGKAVYAGIREFSAEEGEIGLSNFLLAALGIELDTGKSGAESSGSNTTISADQDAKPAAKAITVHAKQLPKGTYVKLRPLEAGYDAEDWKSLLERHLRDTFTTLTNNEILEVPGPQKAKFRFLVDTIEPAGEGICIIDTDLEVDIEALNEDQARETLKQRLEKNKRAAGVAAGSSAGGALVLDQAFSGQVLPGEYVDFELKQWNRANDLTIQLTTDETADLDLTVSPFSSRQRSKPRVDSHIFSDLETRASKRLKIGHGNVELEEAESLSIAIRAGEESVAADSRDSLAFDLLVTYATTDATDEQSSQSQSTAEPGSDDTICKNCRQIIPRRTLPLHEAFCYRNNIACPQCSNVFLKNSDSWKTHWHCSHDQSYGNEVASKVKHDTLFHPSEPLLCGDCGYEAFNVSILAQHRTSTCPAKEILCQFCHLVVPQQGPEDPSFTDPEVLLSGLTPHELVDGGRTTECHLCGRIVRLRDMRTHLLIHDRDRISKPRPRLCVNTICGRSIKPGKESQIQSEQLGLCDDCFGPLHGTGYDPEKKALRRRVERRLLQQLMGGCGKPWCQNEVWCRTGRSNSTGVDTITTAKDAIPIVKPVLDHTFGGDSFNARFCVDESAQSRRATAEMLAAEGSYEVEWCVRALEEGRNDLNNARDWLKDRAPKKGEVIS